MDGDNYLKLKIDEVKELFDQVSDLTNNFTIFNPVIFVHNPKWFKVLECIHTSSTINEVITKVNYNKPGLIKVLRIMRKYGLCSSIRRLNSNPKQQKCPYEWRITGLGEKILIYSNYKYKASQRLIIFRCIFGLNSVDFANLFNRKSGVISNWESGCRHILAITTAEEYMNSILKNLNFSNITLPIVIGNYNKIINEINYRRGKRGRNLPYSYFQALGRIGGKLGDSIKKRENLIKGISKQPPTTYEKTIIEYFKNKDIKYELHPIICSECFDFRINDFIIEAEDKKALGHSYHKAYLMNKKASKVKKLLPYLKFIAVLPPKTSPEVVKLLSKEYFIVMYPDDKRLINYMAELSLINQGYNFPEISKMPHKNKNAVLTRFRRYETKEITEKNYTGYRNKWRLTSFGYKLLTDYQQIKNISLIDLIQDKIKYNYNNNVIRLFAIRYWLFNNPSGHITKSKYLDKSELFIKKILDQKQINHKTQHLIENDVCWYSTNRLMDEYLGQNKFIEIKTIDLDSKYCFSMVGGPIFELIGEALMVKDYQVDAKIYAVILGKNKKINKLPEKVKIILNKYVDGIFIDSNLEELFNEIR